MKQVIVCNNIEELHQSIDKSELSECLNGDLVYNHEEWIQQRIVTIIYIHIYWCTQWRIQGTTERGRDPKREKYLITPLQNLFTLFRGVGRNFTNFFQKSVISWLQFLSEFFEKLPKILWKSDRKIFGIFLKFSQNIFWNIPENSRSIFKIPLDFLKFFQVFWQLLKFLRNTIQIVCPSINTFHLEVNGTYQDKRGTSKVLHCWSVLCKKSTNGPQTNEILFSRL